MLVAENGLKPDFLVTFNKNIYRERKFFLERFGLKNIAMMGLAAVMAVSDLSVSVFAEDIPMHSEVNTTLATPENPVTYIDETTGATVTIYDPDIEVVFPDIMTYSGTVLSGSLFVPMGSLT